VATLSVQKTTTSGGLTATFSNCASGGDVFANSGREFAVFKNTSGGPHVVTIVATNPCSQNFLHNVAYTIAAGAETECGPWSTSYYNSTSGQLSMTYDAVTSLTVAIIGPYT
jgi:hypothetical protein